MTLMQECGALAVFAERLQRSFHAFRGLNFQHLDLDQVDALIHDLQQDMVLMYLLILFNANKRNALFDRQLMVIGITGPSCSTVSILECLIQLNVLPGFLIKRLLLLFYDAIDRSVLADEADELLYCKTFKPYYDTVQLDSQDPYYLQKKKFVQKREAIHNKYLHKPNN
ncbi:hypothetical protein BBJ28_00020772 [Nothophytophthora sp. Chile5]|nr:hypothetical protein BBJ28_00020772 [Nothophytophthora sp. Chile5]